MIIVNGKMNARIRVLRSAWIARETLTTAIFRITLRKRLRCNTTKTVKCLNCGKELSVPDALPDNALVVCSAPCHTGLEGKIYQVDFCEWAEWKCLER